MQATPYLRCKLEMLFLRHFLKQIVFKISNMKKRLKHRKKLVSKHFKVCNMNNNFGMPCSEQNRSEQTCLKNKIKKKTLIDFCLISFLRNIVNEMNKDDPYQLFETEPTCLLWIKI